MWGQLRLLGPVELIVDGDVVAIGGPRQRAIFAFLALNAGSTVLASKVIDAVWGDAAPSSVGKSFTTMLARLRRSVERCGFTIEYTGGGYRCELPRDGLDVDVFARSFDDAVADLAVGNATAAVHRLRAGLQLWRGDPMEDLADYPFVADVAAALTARRGASEDALANALVQMGVFNEAISLLQGQIAATPYDERRWASLIRTLASAGRQRDALQEFQRIRGQLRDELGIEPGHALRMVERDVLDQLTGRPTALRSGVPFVGRIAALETLQQLLDVASQGAPRAALLEGEPGIGKSALASEFARRAHRGGAVVLDVVCTRSDAVPLRLLSNAVRAALITHTAGQRLAELARVLDTLLDGALTTKDDLTALSRRLAYAIEQACGELARFWPLVVVLDNVQWADAMSLGIVRTLLSAPERPLLLIATLRTTDSNAATSTHFFNDLTQVVAVEHVRLAPLACDEVAALVHAIAPLREEEQAVAAIERASGGNPLYVSQLALLMQSTGGHFPRVLPRSLQILLRERVNDLPAECRRMLDIAAVVGEEFSIEVVASVARRDPLEVAALLDDTHRAGIVRESDTLDRYAFVHGLIRQAVYEEMDEARRARLHDALARVLAISETEPSIERALHLRAAYPISDPADVVYAAITGAAAATRVAAFDTAASLYRTVLELAPRNANDACEAKLRLGEVLIAQGNRAEGDQQLAEAAAAAESRSRWDLVADGLLVTRRLGFAATTNEAFERAAELARVLPHISPDDTERRAALLCWEVNLLVNVDVDRAAEALAEAEALATRARSPTVNFDVELARLRRAESRGEDPRRATVRARDLREQAAKAGVLGIAALAGLMVLVSRLRAGETGWELDDRRADELARASGHVEIEVLLDAIRAARAIAVEPIAIAEERSQAALERGTRHGVISSAGVRVLQAFVLRREQHRLHELEALLELGATSGRASLHGLLAACRYEAGDRARARALVEQFVREALPALQRDWVHDAAIALVADVACDLGLNVGAAAMYEQLRTAAGQFVVMASASLVVGRTDRYLGRLALLQQDLDGAIGHFERARELDDATGARLWAGWAAHDEAVARLARRHIRDVEDVARLLRSAASAARWAGSRRLAAATVALRGA